MPAEWLSLSEVASLLGVHPSTVRSWSDQGILPVHRTKGGHRRYRRSEVDLWMQSQRATAPNEVQLVAQQALRNTRLQVSEGRLKEESWYQKLDQMARDQYRESGRTLLQGLINFLRTDGDAGAPEAEAIGYEYASRGRRCGLSALEATHAFLFFRTVLLESMLSVYEAAAVSSAYVWADLFRKVTAFTDQILVTILETYEIYERVNR
ncbi:MAG: helix-turn-helix domain-containing protein [Chloroflexi bacterium]|jgi:excisionase family DNA binding protein|nr:helix-turn-helix domain-containing protein [Chloroflexota bacterium]